MSDNIDTLIGLRLAGIEGVVVHEKQEILDTLEKVMKDSNIAIVLMTTKVIQQCLDVVSKLKLTHSQPLIVEISDRHQSSNISEVIDRYVSEAIGVKL